MRHTAFTASSIATEFIIKLLGDRVVISDVVPEEIELLNSSQTWEITVGYSRGPLASISDRREYRVVRIDDATGQVESMRIRE